MLQGRLDEADALLEQATALASRSPGLRNSWQHLAAIESRVRLLHLRGQSDEAHRLALEAEQNAARRSEHLLRSSYQLLRASILLESGDVGEAASVLEALLLHSAQLSQAQLVELDRILGDYFVRIGEADLARDHLLRAARLNDRASSAIARTYLHRSLAAAGFTAAQDHVERQAEIRVAEPPLDFPSLKAAAQLLQTPGPPDMLGREVLSVLLRSGCVQRAAMGDTPVDVPSDEPDSIERLVIPLGTFLERRYFIEAVPRNDIASLEMLLTVRTLSSGAVEKHEARAREALKTALWKFEGTSATGSPIVASPAMQQALAMIHQLAPSDVPVLLTGETGTGKEVFARELHRASGLKGAFVPFNCTAVARDMLDAQLFGHRRGAFTGATEDLPGVVRSARGGTLFLDEIGELDIELQPKLLRLLDRSEIHPLGEGQPIQVHVRLVAATNANLHEMVERRTFRADLLYRLDVTRVNLPPLRERREEVPLLADHFLEVFARDARKARLTLSDEALEALLLHRWPGNVRQLASEMRRLVAFCKPGSVVRTSDLSPDVTARPKDSGATEQAAAENVLPIQLDQPIDDAVEQLERAMILAALAAEGGHVERAARRLGLSRKGLFLKRRRLRIE